MSRKGIIEIVPTRAERSKPQLEIQSGHLLDSNRKTPDFKSAIEASTKRILDIAWTDGPYDSDPEAA